MPGSTGFMILSANDINSPIGADAGGIKGSTLKINEDRYKNYYGIYLNEYISMNEIHCGI